MQCYHWWCHQYHVVPTLVAVVSCCTSFQLSWLTECSGAISIMWFQYQWCQTVMMHLIWLSWSKECSATIGNAFSILWSNNSASGITWPKSHVAPHFDCLGVRNVVVPFTLLMTSCDANTSANGMAQLESHVAPHLNHLDVTNAVVAGQCDQYHMLLVSIPMAAQD